MSDLLVADRPKHPQNKKLSEALEDDAPRLKAQKGLIDKKATMIKATTEGDTALDLGATMRPDDAQLAAINQFTRKTVTADEVVCFETLSCNDIVDRDDDQFTKDCIKDFAEMEQPYSSVGKSYMLDHEYSTKNQVGRIFSVEQKKVSGVNWLRNGVYIPNTEKNAGLIEDLDFGISWAVSVGVVLGKTACTVCGAGFSSYGWWCVNGHDKGAYYDPNSDETDSWGYPEPCDPSTAGAVKCVRQFSNPHDFYELSQVFLGAQYFAALDKDPAFKQIMKAANSKLPVIGLSAEEARKLPLRHEHPKVSEARVRFGVTEDDTDGSINWTDDSGLRWSFDPSSPEDNPLCLGKTTSNGEEEDDGEHEVSGEPLDADDPSGIEGSGTGSDDPAGQGSGSDQSAADGDEPSGEPGEVTEEDDESEDSEEEETDDESSDATEDEEKGLSKAEVLAMAQKAKAPDSALAAAKDAKDNGLSALILALSTEARDLKQKVSDLTPKAALGDEFVLSLQADAIDWYVKANQTKEEPKVSTTTFEKILDRCGDDVDLLKELAEEQKKAAQAKFPRSVRRSSFPSDPNTLEGRKVSTPSFEEGGDDNDDRVKRIHG